MQAQLLKIKGLYSYPNPLSEVPEGALAVATNVTLNAESVLEPRRGFTSLGFNFADPADRAHQFSGYQAKIISNFSTNKLAYYDTAIGWVAYSGTFQAPDTALARMKFVQAAGNLLFTTTGGVFKLDAYNGTPAAAGAPKALDDSLSLNAAGTGFMSANLGLGSQVAYRHIWGIRDANNNPIVGSPSARHIIANASGVTKDVDHVITIPSGITTAHYLQVFRSADSATSSTEPSDELGLVYEANPVALDISNGYITFTDQTPGSLRGVDLYSNASQEGQLQANDNPPYCKDITFFHDSVFYANVTERHRRRLTLLSVGGTSGVAINDVITIAGRPYTGKATETAASFEFAVVTSGTPSQNIRDTAQSLARVVNRDASSTIYVFYISGVNDLPGQLVIEERAFGGSAFSVIASAHGSAYSPSLPTSGTTVASTAEVIKNGIAVSKSGQPEAVPETNLLFAGSTNDSIRRIIALRDSVFILKDQEGIYRLSGTDPSNFSIEAFDTTTRLLAPETAKVLNNQIWCLSDQGVAVISESGVEVKSLPIEDELLELFGTARNEVKELSFAVASETDRKYILFIPSSSEDTYPTQALVYHTYTQVWTHWDLAKTAGFVNPEDDKIYLGDGASAKVNQERKSFTALDFMDGGAAFTLVSNSSTTIVLNSVVDVAVGDLLWQSSSVKSTIVAIDPVNNTLTVANALGGWTAGAVTVFSAYECRVEFVPYTAGNPGADKHFSEVQLLFKVSKFVNAEVSFASDISPGFESVPELEGAGGGSFGLFPFGQVSFGGSKPARPFRTYVPLEKQRCSQLRIRFIHRQAQGNFRLNGLSIRYSVMGTETTL